jgi:hypothetical protein
VALRFALGARALSGASGGAQGASNGHAVAVDTAAAQFGSERGTPDAPIWALTQGSHNLCDHTPGLGWPIVRQGATLAAAAASPPQVQRVMRFYY